MVTIRVPKAGLETFVQGTFLEHFCKYLIHEVFIKLSSMFTRDLVELGA